MTSVELLSEGHVWCVPVREGKTVVVATFAEDFVHLGCASADFETDMPFTVPVSDLPNVIELLQHVWAVTV